LWGPRSTPFGPSAYQGVVRDQLEEWGEPVPGWSEKPARTDPNPYDAVDPSRPWPDAGPGREALLRIEAARRVRAADPSAPDDDLDIPAAARVAEWDAELDRLVAEARADRDQVVRVPLPSSLSATAVSRLRRDPETFAKELVRPMPRQPSPAARFGTRFHAWVEARFGQQNLFDPDELPGQADAGIDSDDDLADLIAMFERGRFADTAPHAVEAPFALVLAGQVVRGRIDAVYREPDGSWLVVDWKTSRAETDDPLQLALYRLAWADLVGAPVDDVRAGFYYVRSGRLVEPPDLADRATLERLVLGEPAGG
jgi:DNA helicase-2/ATP-dependent DNA helicase PcrA